jgi:hypothetical protein
VASTLGFPEGSIECMPEDYIVRRRSGSRWEVYRVEDILSVKRLVPRSNDPLTLAFEEDLLDSMTPAYFGEVQLLVTAFDPGFTEESAAKEAIQSKALVMRAEGVLRPAREFSRADCWIFRPSAQS